MDSQKGAQQDGEKNTGSQKSSLFKNRNELISFLRLHSFSVEPHMHKKWVGMLYIFLWMNNCELKLVINFIYAIILLKTYANHDR